MYTYFAVFVEVFVDWVDSVEDVVVISPEHGQILVSISHAVKRTLANILELPGINNNWKTIKIH